MEIINKYTNEIKSDNSYDLEVNIEFSDLNQKIVKFVDSEHQYSNNNWTRVPSKNIVVFKIESIRFSVNREWSQKENKHIHKGFGITNISGRKLRKDKKFGEKYLVYYAHSLCDLAKQELSQQIGDDVWEIAKEEFTKQMKIIKDELNETERMGVIK